MFLWLLIFVGLIVLWLLSLKLAKSYTDFDIFGMAGMIVISVILILTIVLLPAEYFSNISNLQDFYAVEETVKSQRLNNMSKFERVGLTEKIAESNEWLKRKKYWNQYRLFDPVIPDEVEELEPIK